MTVHTSKSNHFLSMLLGALIKTTVPKKKKCQIRYFPVSMLRQLSECLSWSELSSRVNQEVINVGKVSLSQIVICQYYLFLA